MTRAMSRGSAKLLGTRPAHLMPSHYSTMYTHTHGATAEQHARWSKAGILPDALDIEAGVPDEVGVWGFEGR